MITRSLMMMALWVALWGELSVANVASGVVVIAVITWMFGGDSLGSYFVRPWGAIKAIGYVGWSLITSSLQVVRAVLLPNPSRIATSIQEVTLSGDSPFIASIVANAITLTPGTLSLEVSSRSRTISVHVLGAVDEQEFRENILKLERVIAGAFTARGNS
jgi:multicomponent Na+:H+ antiporter subunit E